ncbi:hypothetical protein B0T22DRAFT_305150 [Podospora appendiculata]|uniref:Malate dehydrogenase n=1 Tax=Podospora appendiculata TaxID=314037 RepID=A0AAE1C7G2_9PEZI|nr:hypothetical protein B0T22DRAFT_305150 [Podospora appendiculata]
MVSAKLIALAALVAVASASPCKPPVLTLPSTGGSDLAAPPANDVVKRIAIGHGIQNYTCNSAVSPTASATGALAVLYDATPFYPGTPKTGLKQAAWDTLPSAALWGSPLPLNLAVPGGYAANESNPFPSPADLVLGNMAPLKFLGHHYFAADGTPTFDLSAIGLKASVTKNDTRPAPANADKGILGTGAVAWVLLRDPGLGRSIGIDTVYRVVVAGGAAQPCSVTGDGHFSVPYATFYWFYGPK